MKFVVPNPETGLALGDPTSLPVLLSMAGVAISQFLLHCQWRSALIVPLLLVTTIAWLITYTGVAPGLDAPLPDFSEYGTMWQLDTYVDFSALGLAQASTFEVVQSTLPLVSIYIICLFDVGGITYAVSSAAGLIERQGEPDEALPGASSVFIVCALGSMLSAVLGSSPVIVLGESFAGVMVGGRTGLTAIVMGVCFVLMLPLAPVFTAIPLFASAPVLVLLGVDLLRLVKFIDLDDGLAALPSFYTIALMPCTAATARRRIVAVRLRRTSVRLPAATDLYSIDGAIMFGLVMHYLLQAMLLLRSLLPPTSAAAEEDAAPASKAKLQRQLTRTTSIKAADAFGALYLDKALESSMLGSKTPSRPASFTRLEDEMAC